MQRKTYQLLLLSPDLGLRETQYSVKLFHVTSYHRIIYKISFQGLLDFLVFKSFLFLDQCEISDQGDSDTIRFACRCLV